MDVQRREATQMLVDSIKGIGETTADALVAQGYESLQAIAAATPQALESKLRLAGVRMSSARIEQYDWIGQARRALEPAPAIDEFETIASFNLVIQGAERPDGTTVWRVLLTPAGNEGARDDLVVSGSARPVGTPAGPPPSPGEVVGGAVEGAAQARGRVAITGYDVRMNEGRATMALAFGIEVERGAVGRSWSLEVTCREHSTGRPRWMLSSSGDRLDSTGVALREVQLPGPGIYDLDAVFLVDLTTGPEIAYRRLRLNAHAEKAT